MRVITDVTATVRLGKSEGWLHRLGWLVLIWTASVLALGIIAVVFHLLMSVVGLSA